MRPPIVSCIFVFTFSVMCMAFSSISQSQIKFVLSKAPIKIAVSSVPDRALAGLMIKLGSFACDKGFSTEIIFGVNSKEILLVLKRQDIEILLTNPFDDNTEYHIGVFVAPGIDGLPSDFDGVIETLWSEFLATPDVTLEVDGKVLRK